MSLGEDRDTVRKFAKEVDIPFKLLLDEEGNRPRLFGLWGHPNTVLIDRQGRVVGLVRGERDWQSDAAHRLVRQLLSSVPVRAATILAAPEAHEGEQVIVRGTVVKVARAVFPNGRPYYTLLVGDEGTGLTVFTWTRPSVREGDVVEAAGVFHVWRYNLHHMVEGLKITRLGKAQQAGGGHGQ